MQYLFSIFSCLFIYNLSIAQQHNAAIEWGSKSSSISNEKIMEVLDFGGKGLYTISSKHNKLFINHYNVGLILQQENTLQLGDKKQRKNFEFALKTEETIQIFTSSRNKEKQEISLSVNTLDKTTLQLKDDQKIIARINTSKPLQNLFDYTYSPDSSLLLIGYNLPNQSKGNQSFGFHIFDKQSQETWSKQIELPYTNRLYDVVDIQLNNQGNVYVLGKKFDKNRQEKRKQQANYIYHIIAYSDQGNTQTIYPVEINDIFIQEMQLAINDLQEIICSGFYANNNTDQLHGAFFLKIDEVTQQIIQQNTQELTADLLQATHPKKKKQQFNSYHFRDLIIMPDGGITLIAEQYYMRINNVQVFNINVQYPTYHYNDIVVVNMDGKGVINWTTKIKKQQTSINAGKHSSFVLSQKNDKLYFVFNDNKKNLKRKSHKPAKQAFAKRKNIGIAMVTLDANGQQHKTLITSPNDAMIMASPKISSQITTNELVLFGKKDGEQFISRVSFE